MTDKEAVAQKMIEEGAARGMAIEGGWQAFKMLAIHKDASQGEIEALREAFFFGGHHASTILVELYGPKAEPTHEDCCLMMTILEEFDGFLHEFALRHAIAKGNA